MAASAQHYLALRPCFELLTIGEHGVGGQQALLIPQGSISASNLAILRLGENLEFHRSQSRTSSFLLLLTSGGIIVYLLYKNYSEDKAAAAAARRGTGGGGSGVPTSSQGSTTLYEGKNDQGRGG